MSRSLSPADRVGLLHPAIDAHTLGVSSFAGLLEECGIGVAIAPAEPCEAALALRLPGKAALLREWLLASRCTVVGFSYRLDPAEGAEHLGVFLHFLHSQRLLSQEGGPLHAVYFAGLPETCERVTRLYPEVVAVFHGDETPSETLEKLGLPPALIPASVGRGARYDELRLDFGRELIRSGRFQAVGPVDRSAYPGFGTRKDTLLARLEHGRINGLPPLMRAHVGPYCADRKLAVATFLAWSRRLAKGGLLDVLSIGNSQLSQSEFFGDWDGKADGGGVPLRSEEEFAAVWDASRPMLLRCYAGTSQIPRMAALLERSINTAWHALSLWWFSQLDGRGSQPLLQNLLSHEAALRVIADSGKPFEANVPHHFAFRGADDVSYVVSSFLAARFAKAKGIRHFVLQLMLNTPKSTWGVQDLAKARAALRLVRQLEDDSFQVIVQPRGGLDYFSPDQNRAMAQLAAVTALMDDIEPKDVASPPVIHVVSYSEANHLADPEIVNDSIRITRQALLEYRMLRQQGGIPDMHHDVEVLARTQHLLGEARIIISGIDELVAEPTSAKGMHDLFAEGFLPVPHLWKCRELYPEAIRWDTRVHQGSVRVVDAVGRPVSAQERVGLIRNRLKGNSTHA